MHELVEPLVTPLALELVDVEHSGGVLRITIDREGGVDLDTIARVSRAVSRALDESDPISARYTLEVSSPGLERALRRPRHYARAVGEQVSIKLRPGVEGDRRLTGLLVAADDDGCVVELEGGTHRRVPYGDVTKARTVFVWDAERRGAKR